MLSMGDSIFDSDKVIVDGRCARCGAPVPVLFESRREWICYSCGSKSEPPLVFLSKLIPSV